MLVTNGADLRSVKCSRLCSVNFVYKVRAVYVWMGWGAREAGLCDLCGGRVKEKPVALIITCRYGPWASHQMLRYQPDAALWDRCSNSVNHEPTLNCSPMCKCTETLNKEPLMTRRPMQSWGMCIVCRALKWEPVCHLSASVRWENRQLKLSKSRN